MTVLVLLALASLAVALFGMWLGWLSMQTELEGSFFGFVAWMGGIMLTVFGICGFMASIAGLLQML